ncbi:uncharacterized protein CANTADRAFT_25478 [Suhomyces tanzawaensis NRRL Y-17324]|uniref:Uncharacterized protein n=1 Tax=Suhomyces tanzawaensis NRRL Y-17324 TaxID=984487 RepID=A0A1E4SP39_9ASCO|nr:uncharacterized protein CANTADRAFT_25478 [Suhomyces tanzawaensis NRRL Y-17324]ODV81283.1 hypothetical protein CANTADRAFT_25478 [Suhomyces tanzawaensis NRRL Y-17324]
MSTAIYRTLVGCWARVNVPNTGAGVRTKRPIEAIDHYPTRGQQRTNRGRNHPGWRWIRSRVQAAI